MKINKLIAYLLLIEKEHGNIDCITASDDEGNSFTPIYYSPSTGRFDGGDWDGDSDDVNAVCVN